MNFEELRFNPPQSTLRLLRFMAAVGGVTFLAGAVLAPQRMWPNFLLITCFVLGLGLAGIFYVALQYATGSGWSVALRRVPEAMSAVLPIGALGLGILLLLKPSLYPWYGSGRGGVEAIAGFKKIWLSLPFFLARAAIYLASWIALALAIVRNSQRQDGDGNPFHTHTNARLSTVFLVVFGFTFWLASYDWIMSLEPDWYSTIFGIYNFAGLFLSGLAAIIVLAVWLQRLGAFQNVLTHDHLHDLGRLLFAFSTFWAYIWFSQYMLIWYANIPEETSYFVRRLHGLWKPFFILNLLLNWAIPFLVLLPRASKRSADVMLRVSIVVLVGRWLDLYLMILPPFAGPKPVFGAWEIGMMLGAVGLFALLFIHALRKAALVPVRDPFLVESLNYHA